MNRTFVISAISLIAIMMIVGVVSPAMADKDDNSGSNGCEKSDPNAKACEKNPNTDPEDCLPKCPECPPPCGTLP